MATMTVGTATAKQLAFIDSLVADCIALDTDHPAEDYLPGGTDHFTKQLASSVIEALLARRDELKQAAREAGVTPAGEVPEGIHYVAGEVFKVQRSKTGNLYAKHLDLDTERWEYVGRNPFDMLDAETVMTKADAQAFGREYGVCCNCGLTLTDPVSIDAGIGPVCAKKFA